MRKIESQMVESITSGKNRNLGNTRITGAPKGIRRVYLFNNLIAEIDIALNFVTVYTFVKSNTTKSRLNAILRTFELPTIYQSQFSWRYTDGRLCDTDREFSDINGYGK